MHFDITDLKLMLSISEQNSLTRGAEKAYMSAASASIRLKNLEERLSLRLFYRSSQGVELTPAGETFCRHARAVLAQLERLHSDLQTHGQGIKGHIRIFASITAVAEYLPSLLSQFLARNGDIDIDLRECPSPQIIRAVLEGKTDVGIVAGNITSDALETIPFRTDRLVVIAPTSHPLASQSKVFFSDLTDYEHISLPEGSGMYEFVKKQAADLDRKMKIRIQVGNFETFCRMVEAQVGIGIMPYSAASRLRQLHAFSVTELGDPWSFRKLQLCARNFDSLPGVARQLVSLLSEQPG